MLSIPLSGCLIAPPSTSSTVKTHPSSSIQVALCNADSDADAFALTGKAAPLRHTGGGSGVSGSMLGFRGHLSTGESCGILCEELEGTLLVLMNGKADLSARSRIGSQLKEKVRPLSVDAINTSRS